VVVRRSPTNRERPTDDQGRILGYQSPSTSETTMIRGRLALSRYGSFFVLTGGEPWSWSHCCSAPWRIMGPRGQGHDGLADGATRRSG